MSKLFNNVLILSLMTLCAWVSAQTDTFKEKNHWGIKQGDKVLIQPVYDTIFNFDEKQKVCLACVKQKGAMNKFIRTTTYTFVCNYLNSKQQKLQIKIEGNDTCSLFSLGKNTVKQLYDSPDLFVVSAKGKKHLVSKDFKQLTFNGYHEIAPSVEPLFYQAQIMDENETVLSGLIDHNEKVIIPYYYSHIRINPVDSLIMGCAAGIRDGADDDVFDYTGKKISSYRRHIEMITKNHVVHRVFEPKDHFVIYNITTKEEKNLNANEIHFFDHNEILIRIKDDWYVYDLNTHTKKSKQY